MTDCTVLYVASEDRPGDATVAALDAAEFDVIDADGPLDAVARIDDASVDCVLLSLPLREPGAERFVRDIRLKRPDLPILLVGGDEDRAASALGAGATARVRRGDVDMIADRIRDLAADRAVERALARHRALKDGVLAVVRALPAADDRLEVERVVYDQLSSLDRYRFAWIGSFDADANAVRTRYPLPGEVALAGTPGGSPDADAGFVRRAVEEGRITTSALGVRADGAIGRSGGSATPDDGLAAVAVPLTHDGTAHGIVILGTDHPRVPGSAERALLDDLGATVGRELDGFGEVTGSREDDVRRFAQGFAHEIRNALAVASTHIELAGDGDEGALDTAREALDGLERAVDGMLSLAAGVEETTARDFRADVADAWDAVETGDAELIVEESAPIAADHEQAVVLLSNLFRNAVDHGSDAVEHSSTSPHSTSSPEDAVGASSGDDVHVTVRVGVLESGFYVEDDGPGVPPEERDRVFEWGYSVDGSGIGLGLAIVDAIADAHGWAVAATEGSDGGARFEVTGVRRPSD